MGVTISISGTLFGAAPTLGWLAAGAVVLAETDWAIGDGGLKNKQPTQQQRQRLAGKARGAGGTIRPRLLLCRVFAVASLRRTIILLGGTPSGA